MEHTQGSSSHDSHQRFHINDLTHQGVDLRPFGIQIVKMDLRHHIIFSTKECELWTYDLPDMFFGHITHHFCC